MPYTIEKGKHILSPKRWWPALVGVLVGGLITYAANNTSSEPGVAWWWADWADTWITVTTLMVAVFLGLRAWVDELPKRLTIHFLWGDRYALTCWEASLAGEGDIRQWAQSIGRQMCHNEWLEFDPYPVISPPKNEGGERGLRRVYEITISLTKEPPVDGYLVWGPHKNDAASLPERPLKPMTVDEIRTKQGGAVATASS